MATMQAIITNGSGGPEVLSVATAPRPTPTENEVLIKVHAAGINRADILQRAGKYPPPPGVTAILGLECAGEIVEAKGAFKVGDKVMALLSGGGYGEYCAVDHRHVMPVPSSLSLEQAAAIPEVWLTAFQILHLVGKVKQGDYVLIHAGAAGVGSAAIQLCLGVGAHPVVTVGSDAKAAFCRDLGAIAAINYKTQDFVEAVATVTNGHGADFIMDCIGASYADKNMECIAQDGQWVLYGTMGGTVASTLNMGSILRKRIQIKGTTLRARSAEYKADLVSQFISHSMSRFANGEYKPIIDRIFGVEQIKEAHEYMEANQTQGKLIARF